MDIEKDPNRDIEQTKKRTKWGCLSWAAILLFGPIIIFIGIFSFEMFIKEKTLVISHSPNDINTIEVVEKGQPAWFGPSLVKVKYDSKHIERSVKNDGKILRESNFAIQWENDNEATITIYGEEQYSDVIKFNAKESFPFQGSEGSERELGSFTFMTSESPNLINVIELREVSKSKDTSRYSTVQIFYGERGSVLEKYKEHIPSDTYTTDNFRVYWKNDEQVKVAVIREKDSGETYIEDTIEIDLSK
ncbi:hypothetical protein BN988_02831 [Oceanobacillus picturae]|uniref:Uncharacterized protein n=1 Tax=Oceanobacillus picturae TaxID=171693 RepID=W9AMZ0_9BACI|nr:hypothetical protein [Oceanobacillus picturae]CDO04277.1 hypothetical protein BN988_02831 [Oceanobacillus picturae]